MLLPINSYSSLTVGLLWCLLTLLCLEFWYTKHLNTVSFNVKKTRFQYVEPPFTIKWVQPKDYIYIFNRIRKSHMGFKWFFGWTNPFIFIMQSLNHLLQLRSSDHEHLNRRAAVILLKFHFYCWVETSPHLKLQSSLMTLLELHTSQTLTDCVLWCSSEMHCIKILFLDANSFCACVVEEMMSLLMLIEVWLCFYSSPEYVLPNPQVELMILLNEITHLLLTIAKLFLGCC